MKNKKFEIILKKENIDVKKTVSVLTFAEAAGAAYLMKSKLGHGYRIVSVKMVE